MTSLLFASSRSWTTKCWRIGAFKLWCWRILLRVPWTVGRSNRSILKEIKPEYSLEGLMLKLKLQYFGHQMGRTALEKIWCWERLKVRGGSRWQRMIWLDSITGWMDMNFSKLQEIMKDRGAWHAASTWVAKSWTWLSDWTTTIMLSLGTIKWLIPKI